MPLKQEESQQTEAMDAREFTVLLWSDNDEESSSHSRTDTLASTSTSLGFKNPGRHAGMQLKSAVLSHASMTLIP